MLTMLPKNGNTQTIEFVGVIDLQQLNRFGNSMFVHRTHPHIYKFTLYNESKYMSI